MSKAMHPKMQAKAAQVKQAHAELVRTYPGFQALHPHDRIRVTQAHIKSGKPMK